MGAGTHSQLGRAQRWFGPRESGCVLQALFCRFVLCIPLFCIVVVPVPFVCCSVKLPLSRPTSFCLFLSILLRTAAGGEGWPCGTFAANCSQTRTLKNVSSESLYFSTDKSSCDKSESYALVFGVISLS